MRFVLLLALLTDAQAPIKPNTIFCDVVRFYVSRYGEEAAEQWAKRHKWSKARIAEARACGLQ